MTVSDKRKHAIIQLISTEVTFASFSLKYEAYFKNSDSISHDEQRIDYDGIIGLT